MKKRTKIMICLAGALGMTLTLGACATANKTYETLQKKGYNVLVTYDQNGGLFASAPGLDLQDGFKEQNVEKGIKLLAPGDKNRGDGANKSTVSRSGYFLIGWYRNRELRVNENGDALDDNGELCSVSKKEQGYTYSGRWDFETDVLTMDDVPSTPVEKGDSFYYELKLYAAWAPNYTYALQVEQEGEWVQYGETVLRAANPVLQVPSWDEERGSLDYGAVPQYSVDEKAFTLSGMYFNAEKTEKIAENNMTELIQTSISHTGVVDYETGTASGMTIPLYTTWRNGTWFRIKTAKQLSERLQTDGNYEILADLDFNGYNKENAITWSGSSMDFEGTIEGNGHKISNLVSSQPGDAMTAGGLFSFIKDSAVIHDVTFENMQFTVTSGTPRQGGNYGFLAGKISPSATIGNVVLSGELHLGALSDISNYENYTIGIICGNVHEFDPASKGLSSENIKVVADKVWVGYDDNFNDVLGWPFSYTIEENGMLIIVKNEDQTVDPNPSI